MTFGQRLREMRRAQKRDRTLLAVQAGCTPTYIYWLEKDKRTPPLTSKVRRLIQAIAGSPNEETELINLLKVAHTTGRRNSEMPTSTTGTRKHLSNVEFFRVCEEMRNRRETLLEKKPTRNEACKLMTEWLGFSISHHSLVAACEATGIEWEQRRRAPLGSKRLQQDQTTRILGNAIVMLYKKLGEEVPSALAGLIERATGRLLTTRQATNGVTDSEILENTGK